MLICIIYQAQYWTTQAMYVWRNIQTRSCYNCCSGKAICVDIFWVCVCSLNYPACNAHAPYCHLWPVQLHSIFPALSHKRHDFRIKRVFRFFSTTFVWNISHSRQNWERDHHKCLSVVMQSVRCSCQILEKLWILPTYIQKIPRYQISWKFCVVGAELFVRTDRHDEANSHFRGFFFFANAPENVVHYLVFKLYVL